MLQTMLNRGLLAFAAMLLLVGLPACDAQTGQAPSNSASDSGYAAGPAVISMTPAITQMLIDMGKRDRLVGVSQDDDASLELPVCGSFSRPDLAKIVALEPELVLTESPAGRIEDVPQLLRRASEEGLFELAVIPHSKSIADVERALIDPESGLGKALDDHDAAERARKLMSLRIELVGDVLEKVARPRVLMLINPATLGAIGTGVTHDELLRLAGGTNALGHLDSGYPRIDRAQLQQTIRPEVVLILEPGGIELGDADPRLRAFEGLSIPVNESRRFAVIDHPKAMLPSTSLAEVMFEIALVLHPDKTEQIREAYAAAEIIVGQAKAIGEDGS